MTDVGRLRSDIATQVGPRPFEVSFDAAVAELAERQHGVVAHRQLVALGVAPGAIKHRAGTGRWHCIHRGVFAVGHRRLTADGHRMAAVLACGPGAVLGYRDAAALWGLRRNSRTKVDVIAPRSVGSRRGIQVHRVRHLHPDDWTVHDGTPVTTVARTLLDLAEVVRPREVERAFDEAERLRLLDLVALEASCARGHGRHGLKVLRHLIEYRRPSLVDTRSALERLFIPFCRDHGVPMPSVNVAVAGFVVDALWPQESLVAELDGYEFHGKTRAAFENDRRRDATLLVAGYRVIRLTWRRLHHEPERVATDLRALLATSPR
jgi:hypothetical protein